MDNTELTAAVMRHLKITWSSDDTAAEVASAMMRAEGMLNSLIGHRGSYNNVKGMDLDLFLNLCLYLYNGLTLDEFMMAYHQTLTIARQFHVDPIKGDDNEDS